MAAALIEARRGLGRTHPNPPVGAVVVREGAIEAIVSLKDSGEAKYLLSQTSESDESPMLRLRAKELIEELE